MENSRMDQKLLLNRYRQGPDQLQQAVDGLSRAQLDTSPRPSSWTIRQIVHHIVDGDYFWKAFILLAIHRPGSEFSLAWYWSTPQDEWVVRFKYAEREIEPSLELFQANRKDTARLLDQDPGILDKTLTVLRPNDASQIVTVGEVVVMQSDHVDLHIAAIRKILGAGN